MARNAAGERELSEEALHALFFRRNVRIYLAVCPLEVGVCHQARPAMPRAGDVDHVEVVFLDQAVQVDVYEIQAWGRSPMAEQPRLDVFLSQGLLEQRVVVEIDL